MIEPGAQAPDFTLSDQDGNEVSLSGLRGRRVVLVFYPSDFSPVCTDQLNVYQEVLGELEERGVQLLGISVDSAWTHKAFREHLGVTLPLLADFHPKGEVTKAYGLWVESHGVSGRALVMVGPDGTVEWSYRSPSPLEIPGANLIFDALDERRAA
jgi:peroxiredoxin (alkyl hydroperoxide reductase subunit C)